MLRTRTLWSTTLAAALVFVAAQDSAAQEPQPTIVGTAQERGFAEWTRGVQQAGLEERLGERSYTVFIAEDAAYQQVPAARAQAWQTDPEAHRAAVGHTIVEGRITLDELRQREYVRTIDGRQLPVRVEGDIVRIGDAQIREGDIAAGTGMIHQVDRVTWPETMAVDPADPVTPAAVEPIDPVTPAVEPADPVTPAAPVREPVRKD